MNTFERRYVVGTAAAINVELGFVPNYAEVANLTDGTRVDRFWSARVMPFSSGGTHVILPNQKIVGITSGATALLREVIITSGSFAGSNAAGYLIFDVRTKTGTFTSENIKIGSDSPVATITVDVDYDIKTTSAGPASVSSNAITSYLGSSTVSHGITIGSDASTSGKLLVVTAWRDGD